MARYQHYDADQLRMLPICFERQILPGTFEHTLSFLINHEFDLSVFDAQYCNDGIRTLDRWSGCKSKSRSRPRRCACSMD